jgi:hypothetical protein
MLPTLLASVVSGEALIALKRLRLAVTIYVVAAVLALTGIGFLIGAGYVATQLRYGSLWASIYFGAGFILFALVLVIIFKIVAASRVRAQRERRATEAKTLVSAAAIAAVPSLLAARKGPLIAVPLIAGLGWLIFKEWRPKKRPPLDS